MPHDEDSLLHARTIILLYEVCACFGKKDTLVVQRMALRTHELTAYFEVYTYYSIYIIYIQYTDAEYWEAYAPTRASKQQQKAPPCVVGR